ncbi:MAG: hypothetical protein AAF442_06435 [Pseudomonadota bacterium]
MKVLIVAQNLLIARLLISLAERHKLINAYKVIIFSQLEKIILERLHGIPKNHITCPSQIREDRSSKIYAESIEEKRGTYTKSTIKRLQSSLFSMLEINKEFDYQKIWIFNQHTFIGSCLKLNDDYASNCVVFESSNKNGGVTIFGDLHLNHGDHLRSIFLDQKFHSADSIKIGYPKIYRMLALPLHIRSARGFKYYLKRFFTRILNILIFSLMRRINRPFMESINSDPIALIALQIKYDSAIAMNIDFTDYCNLLVDKALEIKATNPEILTLVRPHPLDYSFGWLSIYRSMRRRLPNVQLDLSNQKNFQTRNIRYLITYNSNINRHDCFQDGFTKVIKLSKDQLLPPFNSDFLQFNENTF